MSEINEATFEAQLNAAISKVFPAISPSRISHQKAFSVKFGHHGVVVDGQHNYRAGGRADVLLEMDGAPRVMFELKRPGEPLTDDDRDQGISYARLLEPMPPFTVLSNGEDVRIFRTYDRQEFVAKTAADVDFEKALQFGLRSAAQDRHDAVRVLLGRQPEVWAAVVEAETKTVLNERTGTPGNFAQPLCRELSIRRSATAAVRRRLEQDRRLVVVDGHAQSGKTNVLAALCGWPEWVGAKRPFVFLYVDAAASRQGAFQLLAHHFSRGLGMPVSAEDMRRWIGGGAATDEEHKLVIILDGWTTEAGGNLANDLDDLLLMAAQGSLFIVLGLDTALYEAIRTVPGRPTMTAIGVAPRVNVRHLSYVEFQRFRHVLWRTQKTGFLPGAEHAKPYRRPRVLRAYLADPGRRPPPDGGETQQVAMLNSVAGTELLQLMDRFLVPFAELNDDLQLFSEAITAEQAVTKDAAVMLATYQTGAVTVRMAEKLLGYDRLARLRTQGYCRILPGPQWTALAEVTVPEMLASAASHRIAIHLAMLRKAGKHKKAYRFLLDNTRGLPYGDLAAANAVWLASMRDGLDISDLVRRLMKDRPTLEDARVGSVMSAYGGDGTELQVHLGEGMENEKLVRNPFPWLVLSRLLSFPLGDNSTRREVHLQLLAQVGSFPYILRNPGDFSLQEMVGVHVHDIPDVGSFVCASSGTIEPINEAIRQAFCSMPEEAVALANIAHHTKSMVLAYRVNAVCESLREIANAKIAASAMEAKKIAEPVIHGVLKEIMRQHGVAHPAIGRDNTKLQSPAPE